MSRLRVLVADDEPLARTRLRRLLEGDGNIDVVAECSNGTSAMAAIRELRPDVAFLDICMPDMDGFQVLARGTAVAATRVIFVTAYANHAVRAFDAAAQDYLLKPLSPQRLQAALKRVRAAMILPGNRQEGYRQHFIVRTGARMQLLPVAEVDCVTAQSNYVELHSREERHRVRASISEIELQLDPRQFARIHRSHIVRIEAIRDIELLESGQYLLRLLNGRRLPSGRRYRDRVRETLGLASRPSRLPPYP